MAHSLSEPVTIKLTKHLIMMAMFQAVLRLSDLAWPWTTTYITEGGAAGATWLHLAPLRTGSAGITGWRESGRTGINGFGLKYFFLIF